MAVWHTKMDSYPNYGGLAHKLDNVKVALAAVLAFVLLYLVAFLGKKHAEKREGADSRKKLKALVIAFSAAVVIAGAVFVIYGIKSGDSIFKFDYKWGTYRGYIWSKCWETFKDAPLLKKLFGYGNESIKQAVTVPNYNDMVAKTNRIYDNAHNEVLQYLITLGLFGALSYIALVVSAVWYMCKYGAKTMHTYIPVFVVCGYFVQGLVNLNQPITTPLFFVILGMGVGYAREQVNSY
jgi:O-antigen ligase